MAAKLIFRSFQKDDKFVIEIQDTGGGISEANKAKIFNPFFTTKDKGLGLGLSVVYKIVNQHDGQILLDNKDKGTLATLILPQLSANINSI